MQFLQIFITIAFFALNSLMTRLFQLHISKKPQSVRLYQGMFCLVASLLNLTSDGILKINLQTLILAFLFGLFFAVASHFGAECYQCGPMSLTSLIINLSLSIPLIYSFFIFGEKITLIQGIGLTLLSITFFISAFCFSGKMKISVKWIVLVTVGFFANGSTAVIQKNQQLASPGNSGMFLFTAYLISAIYFLILYVKENNGFRDKPSCQVDSIWKLGVTSVLAGVGSFMGNALLGYLSVRVNAAVLYPSVNGGLVVITALISFLFFGEKVNYVKIISIIIGITAIVLLTI